MSATKNQANTPHDPKRSFIRAFNAISVSHQAWRVFSDFCEMSAIAIANNMFVDEEREKRYLEIAKAYEKDDLERFSGMLADVVLAQENEYQDFLGEIFMSMELSSHWHGQFFTPSSICKTMAQMIVSDGSVAEKVKQNGFVTMCEPACGGGATIIAFAEAMKGAGMNFQEAMHVTAVDVDPTAAHMCFIQLSLIGVPAIVYVGNTLSQEIRSSWKTPMHHLGLWDWKLKKANGFENEREVFQAVSKSASDKKTNEQLVLF